MWLIEKEEKESSLSIEPTRISDATLTLDTEDGIAPFGFVFGPGLILVPGPITNGNPLGTCRSPETFTEGAFPDEGSVAAG